MDETTNSTYNFNSLDLIVFIKKKFIPLAVITIMGAIVSMVVAMLIQEKFRSSVILFPTSSGSVSATLLRDNNNSKGVTQFGEQEEVEQMMQVLQSDEIRDKVVKKFNLEEHYEIPPDSKLKMTALGAEYNGNVAIKRTEFMSVRIDVLDKDPQMAADMANAISSYLDTVMNRMQKERARKALQLVEYEYRDLENEIKKLEDSLTVIRKLGVNDYESQAEVFNQAYAKVIASNDARATKLLEGKLEVLAKYGGAYMSITQFLENEMEHLSELKARYAEAKVDAEQELPHKFIVNRAFKAEKKSYPIRWLIVVVSTISTAVFALLTMLVIDLFKKAN